MLRTGQRYLRHRRGFDGQRGKMIDSRGFEARVPTSASNASEMVASLNKAFDNVLRDVVPWVAKIRKKTT